MTRESFDGKRSRVKRIVATLKKTHPDAKLALNFTNPLELLVALILAAQARDDLVNIVTADLFGKYRAAADYANEKETVLQQQVNHINFYRNKTRSIQRACRVLVEQFGGQVPRTLEELTALPGVGRKTANIILGNAFGLPAIGVDTHVGRLAQRLGLTRKVKPDDIEFDIVEMVPKKDWVKFCHLLQFHGRRVCAATAPHCPNCAISALCSRIGVETGQAVKR